MKCADSAGLIHHHDPSSWHCRERSYTPAAETAAAEREETVDVVVRVRGDLLEAAAEEAD